MLPGVLAPRILALTALLALSGGASSCLVTSTDSFPDPPATPPFLNGARATPPLNQLLLVDPASSQPITFSATVRSEDAGDELIAHLVADWPNTNGALQIIRIAPGTFSDERLISMTWNPRAPTLTSGQPLAPGCHPITLVVAHNFNPLSSNPAPLEDADFLVWWVVVGDPKNPNYFVDFNVSSCPNPQKLPSTGGSP